MRMKYGIKIKIQIILCTLHEMPVHCRLKKYVTITVLDIILKSTTFRRPDYVSVFRWNLLRWTQ
jgi:hypothetical protein